MLTIAGVVLGVLVLAALGAILRGLMNGWNSVLAMPLDDWRAIGFTVGIGALFLLFVLVLVAVVRAPALLWEIPLAFARMVLDAVFSITVAIAGVVGAVFLWHRWRVSH